MNFAQLRFWWLLFCGLLALGFVRVLVAWLRREWLTVVDKLGLLFLGLFLLFFVSWITLIVFLVVAVGSYVGLQWILRYHPRHAFRYVPILITLQLAPLVYYKYADFIGNRVLGLQFDCLRDLIIPVGISFYTFQKVAFVIDTLVLKEPLPGFLNYLNFAGFFPQIVAGPIERRKDLLPQMENFQWRWDVAGLNEGAAWIALGFFFKCGVADNLANYFDGSVTGNAYLVWLANLVFGLRIYYDFAGYSLIALGIASCLGVRLTLNFASPYCATSFAEFWRRWHITLSQWFRDYLYIPLGGGRVAWWAANVLLVFVVSGIWHGAGWNFLLWGAVHGLGLIFNRLVGGKNFWLSFGGWLVTMAGVFFSWLCFYEIRVDALLAKMLCLVTPASYGAAAFHEVVGHWPVNQWIVLFGFFSLAAATLFLEWLSVRWRQEPYYYLRRPWMAVILILLTVWLAPGENNGFIYFAF